MRDISGKKVLAEKDFDTSQSLDVNSLPSGIYILLISSAEERRVIKFLME